ncbi:MAG: phage terminase large subunit family protein [Planctomycetaceae bacterium]|nr:phage terminase large subunit family protein [Planctomycetaceae bacterium]
MGRLDWCDAFVHLRGRSIDFSGRPYLPSIYASSARRIVLRCSRQVEKTTFLCNVVLHTVTTMPGVRVIVVFPRQDQAGVFAKSRLMPMITESPVISKVLLGPQGRRPQVMHMQFRNGSEVYIRAAFHSADAVRGIDGDFLLIDEFQDIAGGDLPVLEETLSHSAHRRVCLTGTPKSVDNHLEDVFRRSTANEWRVPCACGHQVFLDEKVLGPEGPMCPECRQTIDPATGLWVPRNPQSAWGAGFTLNHLATPWLNYPELLERHDSYNPALFRNECLGLPTFLGDHIVTREEVEACCGSRPMARCLDDVPVDGQRSLIAGIDWGGGAVSRTVLVIGFIRDDRFIVVHMVRFPAVEDPNEILRQVRQCCQRFRVVAVAADGGGNGNVYNNLLLHELPSIAGLYAMLYSAAGQQPTQRAGRLWNWTIGRSPSLGMVFTRIKKHRVEFPRLEDSRSFLDEIWCEVAEYDDHQRTIRYTHPETQPDDTLHATNYAATLARHMFNAAMRFDG